MKVDVYWVVRFGQNLSATRSAVATIALSTRRVIAIGLVGGFAVGMIGFAASETAASLLSQDALEPEDYWAGSELGELEASATPSEQIARAHTVRITSTRCDTVRSGLGVMLGRQVLTARHVTAGAETIEMQMPNGEWVDGKALLVSNQIDLSMVELPTAASLDSGIGFGSATAGDAVVMSRGLAFSLRPLTTSVDEHRRGLGGQDPNLALSLNAEAIPGDSGGGVFDLDGALVGLVYAQAFGDLSALAIPSEEIRAEIPRLESVAFKNCG